MAGGAEAGEAAEAAAAAPARVRSTGEPSGRFSRRPSRPPSRPGLPRTPRSRSPRGGRGLADRDGRQAFLLERGVDGREVAGLQLLPAVELTREGPAKLFDGGRGRGGRLRIRFLQD